MREAMETAEIKLPVDGEIKRLFGRMSYITGETEEKVEGKKYLLSALWLGMRICFHKLQGARIEMRGRDGKESEFPGEI